MSATTYNHIAGRPSIPPAVRAQARRLLARIKGDGAPVESRMKVSSPEDAATIVAGAYCADGHPDRETLGLLLFDAGNRLIDATILQVGTVNQAPVYPREVVRACLDAGATACILWHNHPGGQCFPSAEDLELTRSLGDLLRALDIRLHDHLIYADGSLYSVMGGRKVLP